MIFSCLENLALAPGFLLSLFSEIYVIIENLHDYVWPFLYEL